MNTPLTPDAFQQQRKAANVRLALILLAVVGTIAAVILFR